MVDRKLNTLELFNALLLLALGAWIWWYTADFPSLDEGYPGPSLFPRIVAAGFIGCGLLLLLLSRKTTAPMLGGDFSPSKIWLLAAGLLMIGIFPYLINVVGFVVSLGLLCFGFGMLLRVKWWKAALTATLTATVIYFLFVIGLGVSL